MLNVKILSYNSHFDTFHIEMLPYDKKNRPCGDELKMESLIPAILLPYVAPSVYASCHGEPYGAVGQEFNLTLPTSSI